MYHVYFSSVLIHISYTCRRCTMSDENLVNGELLEDGVVVAVNNSDVFGLVNSELINPVLLLDDIDLINHFFCLDDNYKTFSINDKLDYIYHY